MTDGQYRMELSKVCKDPVTYNAYVTQHLEIVNKIESIRESIPRMDTGSSRLDRLKRERKEMLRELERNLADFEKDTLRNSSSGSSDSNYSSGNNLPDGNCFGSIGKVIGIAVVLLILLAMCGT